MFKQKFQISLDEYHFLASVDGGNRSTRKWLHTKEKNRIIIPRTVGGFVDWKHVVWSGL